MQACVGHLAVEPLLSIDEAHTKIFGFGGTLGSASGAVGVASCEDQLAPYPHEKDRDDWDLADVSANSYVDVHATLPQSLEAFYKLCYSAMLPYERLPARSSAWFSESKRDHGVGLCSGTLG